MSRNASVAMRAAAITPSDSVNFERCTGIYVGGTGTVVAIINGNAVTFTNVGSGTILPISATRVNSTSTTATNLVALYN